MLDLLVRGGALITPAGVARADLAVEDGRIVAIEEELPGPARATLDAYGLHVFPGLVDAHVHFNEPGRQDWEGLRSGSAALAAGGGTVFCDMPLNSHPPLLSARDFTAKRRAAEAASLTDFALWGGLTPDSLERLGELAEAGVIGFKAFMSSSGIAEFRAADDLTLYQGMLSAARLGLPVAVHAESESITRELSRQLRASGGKAPADYLASRPVLAELEAIHRALFLAEETGCELHVVHVSTARGVALIQAAKARGVRVSCETCPHYLHFSAEDVERLGAVAKCAPPLRAAAERDALWQALSRGEVDLVASDHSPAPPELKGSADFFEVWGGVAGVQSSLNVLLKHHEAKGLRLEHLAALTAARPAERFRLPGKGRLEVGFDADLALVDLSVHFTLRPEDLLTRHRLSPYLGHALRGQVVRTLLRGETVVENGRPVGAARGRLLEPTPKT